ncbi:phosphate ABC transporter substrate-binding protein PstS [Acetobacteraceae bacterium]|nr:phosphate ABC transporter substrate-binding protein PstS [Acetobacteraceae bacterium]
MRHLISFFVLPLLAVSALAGRGYAAPSDLERLLQGDLMGAGSSFAAPVYMAWGEEIKKKFRMKLNYQAIGSSAGVDQAKNALVDFGSTDIPLSREELEKEGLYQFPVMMSGAVVIVNVPGVPRGELRLTGEVLADIYAGKITLWNDPRIQVLNPKFKLPEIDIGAVHRGDGSGTSFVFTSYLSEVSPTWKKNYGAGALIAWEGGAGARGNDGIAALVRQTPGAIGYVEYTYAAENGLSMAQLKNKDGFEVSPNMESFKSAAAHTLWKAPYDHLSVLNEPGKNSWPITAANLALIACDHSGRSSDQGRREQAFFAWSLRDGVNSAQKLGYLLPPSSVSDEILQHWPQGSCVPYGQSKASQ